MIPPFQPSVMAGLVQDVSERGGARKGREAFVVKVVQVMVASNRFGCRPVLPASVTSP